MIDALPRVKRLVGYFLNWASMLVTSTRGPIVSQQSKKSELNRGHELASPHFFTSSKQTGLGRGFSVCCQNTSTPARGQS